MGIYPKSPKKRKKARQKVSVRVHCCEPFPVHHNSTKKWIYGGLKQTMGIVRERRKIFEIISQRQSALE